MRFTLCAAALSMLLPAASFAQSWTEYLIRPDSFAIVFPGEPKVQDITYRTEYSVTVPGRVYSQQNGGGRYSVTVIDYTGVEKLHAARLAACKAELGDGDSCTINQARADIRGAITYATFKLMQRDARVTHLTYATADLVEGNQLQLTNKDESRTFAAIHMHKNRLYILEGTVPKGAPAPGLFQQSLQFLDEEGYRIRYNTPYSNGMPVPTHFRYR